MFQLLRGRKAMEGSPGFLKLFQYPDSSSTLPQYLILYTYVNTEMWN